MQKISFHQIPLTSVIKTLRELEIDWPWQRAATKSPTANTALNSEKPLIFITSRQEKRNKEVKCVSCWWHDHLFWKLLATYVSYKAPGFSNVTKYMVNIKLSVAVFYVPQWLEVGIKVETSKLTHLQINFTE